VSAVKVGGRRLNHLARAGQDVERAPRVVHVDRFAVEAFEEGPYPAADVLVECGSGTYVRSLAADLGVALGGCAHLASLRRLSVGSFTIDEAVALDRIAAEPAAVVVPLAAAMRDLERVAVDDERARAARHGIAFPAGALGEQGGGPYALLDGAGELVAVYERKGAACKPAVVLADAQAS
jgi:tRNA pseudouridine55 synthase